jgi:hypothetical protein
VAKKSKVNYKVYDLTFNPLITLKDLTRRYIKRNGDLKVIKSILLQSYKAIKMKNSR